MFLRQHPFLWRPNIIGRVGVGRRGEGRGGYFMHMRISLQCLEGKHFGGNDGHGVKFEVVSIFFFPDNLCHSSASRKASMEQARNSRAQRSSAQSWKIRPAHKAEDAD